MQKLNLEFTPTQVLKSASLNTITGKVDEIVEEVNKLPQMVAATSENALKIQSLQEKEVDILQSTFDEMMEKGTLDTTKDYYTYEE